MVVQRQASQAARRSATVAQSSGTIVDAAYREDGWEIEVEIPAGVRLSYWVGGADSAPSIGSTITFYHGGVDDRVCCIEIDGQPLFDSCAV